MEGRGPGSGRSRGGGGRRAGPEGATDCRPGGGRRQARTLRRASAEARTGRAPGRVGRQGARGRPSPPPPPPPVLRAPPRRGLRSRLLPRPRRPIALTLHLLPRPARLTPFLFPRSGRPSPEASPARRFRPHASRLTRVAREDPDPRSPAKPASLPRTWGRERPPRPPPPRSESGPKA